MDVKDEIAEKSDEQLAEEIKLWSQHPHVTYYALLLEEASTRRCASTMKH
jgi:hypothetical protein